MSYGFGVMDYRLVRGREWELAPTGRGVMRGIVLVNSWLLC